jgi:hypothetical protein
MTKNEKKRHRRERERLIYLFWKGGKKGEEGDEC